LYVYNVNRLNNIIALLAGGSLIRPYWISYWGTCTIRLNYVQVQKTKTAKILEIFSKFKKPRIYVLGNRKLAQLEMPKNRGELYNDVNIAKSKNWKTEKIQDIFRNWKKIYRVIGNVNMKAHAKFEEASSIGNT